jgi:hypothetical protein
MSTLNLVANLLVPHYPTLYLVRSEVMEEAERRTGLPFHYVVGRVVDESGAKNIVMEGWSEIAGSFKDDDKLLSVSPSAEEDEKIEIRDSSHQTIYVPSCPRFRRTDDSQTFPLRRFIESPRGLIFARHQYVVRLLQALIRPPLRYQPQSNVGALLPQQLYSILSNCLWRSRQLVSTFIRKMVEAPNSRQMDLHESLTVSFISTVELFATFVLSKFSAQQSTSKQRSWIVTWLFAGSLGGGISMAFKQESTRGRRVMACFYMVTCGVPAIGGFVVVCRMLSAYGICYKTV